MSGTPILTDSVPVGDVRSPGLNRFSQRLTKTSRVTPRSTSNPEASTRSLHAPTDTFVASEVQAAKRTPMEQEAFEKGVVQCLASWNKQPKVKLLRALVDIQTIWYVRLIGHLAGARRGDVLREPFDQLVITGRGIETLADDVPNGIKFHDSLNVFDSLSDFKTAFAKEMEWWESNAYQLRPSHFTPKNWLARAVKYVDHDID